MPVRIFIGCMLEFTGETKSTYGHVKPPSRRTGKCISSANELVHFEVRRRLDFHAKPPSQSALHRISETNDSQELSRSHTNQDIRVSKIKKQIKPVTVRSNKKNTRQRTKHQSINQSIDRSIHPSIHPSINRPKAYSNICVASSSQFSSRLTSKRSLKWASACSSEAANELTSNRSSRDACT